MPRRVNGRSQNSEQFFLPLKFRPARGVFLREAIAATRLPRKCHEISSDAAARMRANLRLLQESQQRLGAGVAEWESLKINCATI
jgi:hypothetical protein